MSAISICVGLTCHSSGPIYVTLVESTLYDGIKKIGEIKMFDLYRYDLADAFYLLLAQGPLVEENYWPGHHTIRGISDKKYVLANFV